MVTAQTPKHPRWAVSGTLIAGEKLLTACVALIHVCDLQWRVGFLTCEK